MNESNASGAEIALVLARAKRRFPGYEVDAAYPIGWPVYTVRLALTVLAEQEISTVARYILRLVGLGPTVPAELGRLLGLSDKFVAGGAAELLSGVLVVQRPDLHLEVTELGRQTLANGGRSWSPRREHMSVPFCPITRQVLDIGTDGLMYPDVARKNGLFVVPNAGGKPRLGELRIEAIKDYARAEEGIKPDEITEIAEIHNRDARLRYRNDITVVKLVAPHGGQPSFAAFRGRECLEEETISLQRLADSGINLTPEEYERRSYAQWQLPPGVSPAEENILSSVREDYQAVREAEQSIAEAQVARQDTQDARERAELPRRLAELEAERDGLANRLVESEKRISEQTGGTVRILKTEEHRPLLLEAIDNAESELTLVSAFVSSEAFDTEIRRKLRQAMTRGVRVRIAWGLGTAGRGAEATRKRTRGENALAPLRQSVSNSSLKDQLIIKRAETHQKFIICDNKFAAQGSFNWLSFRGEFDSGYHADQEGSTYSERPDFIALWKEQADALFR